MSTLPQNDPIRWGNGPEFPKMMYAAEDMKPELRQAFEAGMRAAGAYLTDVEGRFRPSSRYIMERLREELDLEATRLSVVSTAF